MAKHETLVASLIGLAAALFAAMKAWAAIMAQIESDRQTVREAERAYLWGGGPLVDHPGLAAGSRSLSLTVNNYGKTPGLLIKYAVGFCPRTNIPPTPQYTVEQSYHDWIRPDPQANWGLGFIDFTERDPLIFGRFWFKDVWGDSHSIGFVLVTIEDIDAGDEGTSAVIPADIAANLGSAYTEWY